MSALKETAELYRRALLLGIVEAPDVIVWADSVIISEVSPDYGLIEASLAGSKDPKGVAIALEKVSGDFNKPVVIQRLLRLMSEWLQQDSSQAPRIARWLFDMATDDEVPSEDARSWMWWFYDEFDLAADGVQGTVEEVTKLLQFLDRYSNTVM